MTRTVTHTRYHLFYVEDGSTVNISFLGLIVVTECTTIPTLSLYPLGSYVYEGPPPLRVSLLHRGFVLKFVKSY